MYKEYKNAMEFAEASREHGPWLIVSGQDELVCPHCINDIGAYFKYTDDGDSYFVAYSTMVSKYRWQDCTPCAKLV